MSKPEVYGIKPIMKPFSIATFNLYNLFMNPPETAVPLSARLSKLTLAIKDTLLLPEIIAVQEVDSTAVLQQLAIQLNKHTGADYQAAAHATSDRRGIQVGVLYDQSRVIGNRLWQMSGPEVEAAFGISSFSPGREPFVGEFVVGDRLSGGRPLTLIVNHFKSNYVGEADPALHEQMRQASEAQRMAQAQVVRDFVNDLLAADSAAWVLVAGDLNDCPRRARRDGRTSPVTILEGSAAETPLVNLLMSQGNPFTYTFFWEGDTMILDHLLASPSLAQQLTAVRVPHINTPFSPDFGHDPTTPFRSSDHDPLIAWFG